MYIILLQSRSSPFLSRLFVAERNSTNGGVEMECIQASCMHLFPYPGNRSCRNSNAAARELVIARSVEGETAGGFRRSCSYGIQGSSSARRKCREEGFKGQQKFILQANKNLGRNRIDTLETVDDVVLLGNIFLHPRAPHRRKSGVCHVIPTIGENNARSTVKEFGDSDSLGKAFSPWVRGNEYRGEWGLNHRLVNAVDADSVLAEVTEVLARSHWRSASLLLSPLNSATALHRIAKHMDQASMSKSERLAFARRKEMVELQNAAIKALSKSSVQGISNIAWALSKIGGSAIYFGEMDIVATAASDCVEEFKPQNLANTAGAFASMQHLSSPLFSSMSQQASLVAADFRPQELVQFLWAFA
ncbi:hypothetical protein CY35_16G091200 [Sphagnum magellanicum]|nr:hypothetical protein CY35_16G091200 [Sphagnum magellanicum]